MKQKEKLNLYYIIIGELENTQKEYLQQNLHKDEPQKNGIQVIWLEETSVPCTVLWDMNDMLPEQCLFISQDKYQLHQAISVGCATLGYLCQEKERARAHDVENVDKSVDNLEKMCANMEKHSEVHVVPKSCEVYFDIYDANPDMWAEGFEEIGLDFLIHVYERHHGLPWTILETERCIIKEFSMEYLDDLFELYSGEGMTDYMEPLYPYEEERAYQEAYIKHMYGFYGYGMWIVCEKETGKLIGRAGVEHREELDGEMELGYAIGVPYQRKGYATEVCRGILTYVKEELLQDSICCLIEEGNEISECFAKKLGFDFECILTLETKSMKKYTYRF